VPAVDLQGLLPIAGQTYAEAELPKGQFQHPADRRVVLYDKYLGPRAGVIPL
jgi:hypothetical protein